MHLALLNSLFLPILAPVHSFVIAFMNSSSFVSFLNVGVSEFHLWFTVFFMTELLFGLSSTLRILTISVS